MMTISIISSNTAIKYFTNIFKIQQVYSLINVVFVPDLAPANETDWMRTKKYQKEINLKDDLHKHHKVNGYIYQAYINGARFLAQKERLYQTFDESIAWSEKTEIQRQLWKRVVQFRRPLFLSLDEFRYTIATQCFLPVWQILDTKQNNNQHKWRCRVGGQPPANLNITGKFPFIEYECDTLLEGLEYAYEQRAFFQDTEQNKLDNILKNIVRQNNVIDLNSFYLAARLQDAHDKEVVWDGNHELFSLRRLDPHGLYCLIIQQKATGEMGWIALNGISTLEACQKTEAFFQLLKANTQPQSGNEVSMINSLLKYFHYSSLRWYKAHDLRVGNKINLPLAWIWEFSTSDFPSILVITAQTESSSSIPNTWYAFNGNIKSLISGKNYSQLTLKNTWGSPQPNKQIDSLIPLGGIHLINATSAKMRLMHNKKASDYKIQMVNDMSVSVFACHFLIH